MSKSKTGPTPNDLLNVIKSAIDRTGLGKSRIIIDDATMKKLFPGWVEGEPRPSTVGKNVTLDKPKKE